MTTRNAYHVFSLVQSLIFMSVKLARNLFDGRTPTYRKLTRYIPMHWKSITRTKDHARRHPRTVGYADGEFGYFRCSFYTVRLVIRAVDNTSAPRVILTPHLGFVVDCLIRPSLWIKVIQKMQREASQRTRSQSAPTMPPRIHRGDVE